MELEANNMIHYWLSKGEMACTAGQIQTSDVFWEPVSFL